MATKKTTPKKEAEKGRGFDDAGDEFSCIADEQVRKTLREAKAAKES